MKQNHRLFLYGLYGSFCNCYGLARQVVHVASSIRQLHVELDYVFLMCAFGGRGKPRHRTQEPPRRGHVKPTYCY